VKQKPVVRVFKILRRDSFQERLLYLFGSSAFCKSNLRADSQKVCIYRHCRLMKNYIQNNVCSFTAYTTQSHQLIAVIRHFASKIVN
jgi:hypothetical protein